MPTYEYACTECGDRLEVVQSFSDAPLTTCPACQGTLRKLFSPVGVVFKGSGFYKTDSRNGKPKTASSATASSGKDGDASSTSDTSDKPATTGSDSSSSNGAAKQPAAASTSSKGTQGSTGGDSKVA